MLRILCALCAIVPLCALDDAELDRRIAALRMQELRLPLVLPAGVDASTPVRYRLIRHAFNFGTCIAAQGLGIPRRKRSGDIVEPLSAADQEQYQTIVRTLFSGVVAENEMKWALMEWPDGTRYDDCALAMYEWAAQRGLRWRGHCGIWGVPRWLPEWQKTFAQEPADVVTARVQNRLTHIATLFRGRITDWDVANELLDQDVFGKAIGDDAALRYFAWMEAAAPGQRWFVNEYKGLQNGTPEKIVAFAKRLLDQGAPVRGIGDQAHYHRPVPDAATLWQQLDVLGSLGLPVHITELDIAYKDMTPEDHAEQLRRFYRVAFAHPSVDAIYLWGFWAGLHWRPGAALWRKDWTITPAGQAYVDLMTTEWVTTGEAVVADGAIHFRGFPGRYRLEIGNEVLEIDAVAVP